MSFTDRLVLWLHIAFAIFTIGPVTLAISSTPRYIRRRELPVLRYFARITLAFTAASLLVFITGVVAGQQAHAFDHPWLTISMTLFIVAIVLLAVIARDQQKAITALTPAPARTVSVTATEGGTPADSPAAPDTDADQPAGDSDAPAAELPEHVASVESGRIAALGGIVNLIWLVVLVLMVWRP